MAGQRNDLGPPCVEDLSIGLKTLLTMKSILHLLHVGFVGGHRSIVEPGFCNGALYSGTY